ncbi:hypothetical protein LTR74_017139 [Friedmanniomyces endolithicus]|nr:hypothetical protein LTR74_017139 [Friedmanniomyces endolithicus]
MAHEIHDALDTLAPAPYYDPPLHDLPSYLTTCFTAAELICIAIPMTSGEPFPTARPHHSTPDPVRSAKGMHVSLVRSSPPHESHEALQKHWGKPYKFGAARMAWRCTNGRGMTDTERGLRGGVCMRGVGFSKFRRAIRSGRGAARGLLADKRPEHVDVEGVGHLEVYLLSGQMPKSVTPRGFVQVLMCSEDSLTEKSASHVKAGRKHVPRSYVIVSKPTQHPEAGDRSGFVRGQYESVEMIREIPLHRRKAAESMPNLLNGQNARYGGAPGRDRGATVGSIESRGTDREADGGQA